MLKMILEVDSDVLGSTYLYDTTEKEVEAAKEMLQQKLKIKMKLGLKVNQYSIYYSIPSKMNSVSND